MLRMAYPIEAIRIAHSEHIVEREIQVVSRVAIADTARCKLIMRKQCIPVIVVPQIACIDEEQSALMLRKLRRVDFKAAYNTRIAAEHTLIVAAHAVDAARTDLLLDTRSSLEYCPCTLSAIRQSDGDDST